MTGDAAKALGEANRAAILAFIRRHSALHGVTPSSREIAAGIGIKSTSSVSDHVRQLEAEGKLKRVSRRAIALVGRGPLKVEGFVS